jgi:hypothetical protein
MPATMKEVLIDDEWFKVSEELYNDKNVSKCFRKEEEIFDTY